MDAHAGLVIVGSGFTGLAHAYEAQRRGEEVLVIEHDEFAKGASARGSGHVSPTLAPTSTRADAATTRETWLSLAEDAGVWVEPRGSLICARTEAESAVLAEFAQSADVEVERLSVRETTRLVDVDIPDLRDAVRIPEDLAINPRQAITALCSYLADLGVGFVKQTHVKTVSPANDDNGVCVETARGTIHADRALFCIGHHADRLFPDVTHSAQMERCRSHLLEVRYRDGRPAPPERPVLVTGTSMLGFEPLARTGASDAVFEEIAGDDPELLEHHVNLTAVSRPGGTIVIGATHRNEADPRPFDDYAGYLVLREQGERLLGADLEVLRSWSHVHLTSGPSDLARARPLPGATVVVIGSHLAATTAFGVARTTLDDLE